MGQGRALSQLSVQLPLMMSREEFPIGFRASAVTLPERKLACAFFCMALRNVITDSSQYQGAAFGRFIAVGLAAHAGAFLSFSAANGIFL